MPVFGHAPFFGPMFFAHTPHNTSSFVMRRVCAPLHTYATPAINLTRRATRITPSDTAAAAHARACSPSPPPPPCGCHSAHRLERHERASGTLTMRHLPLCHPLRLSVRSRHSCRPDTLTRSHGSPTCALMYRTTRGSDWDSSTQFARAIRHHVRHVALRVSILAHARETLARAQHRHLCLPSRPTVTKSDRGPDRQKRHAPNHASVTRCGSVSTKARAVGSRARASANKRGASSSVHFRTPKRRCTNRLYLALS